MESEFVDEWKVFAKRYWSRCVKFVLYFHCSVLLPLMHDLAVPVSKTPKHLSFIKYYKFIHQITKLIVKQFICVAKEFELFGGFII